MVKREMLSTYLTLLKQRLFSAILAIHFLFPQENYSTSTDMESKASSFLTWIGLRTSSSNYRHHMDVEVTDIKNQTAMSICNINVNATASQQDSNGPCALDADKENLSEDQSSNVESVSRASTGSKRNFSISVMLSKPILALEFNHLKMRVEAPTTVTACSQNTT